VRVGQTSCVKNTDPAELFTRLHSFSTLWKNAITPSGAKYSLEPLVKIKGSWCVGS
jgi:hypothetical protein